MHILQVFHARNIMLNSPKLPFEKHHIEYLTDRSLAVVLIPVILMC